MLLHLGSAFPFYSSASSPSPFGSSFPGNRGVLLVSVRGLLERVLVKEKGLEIWWYLTLSGQERLQMEHWRRP